MTVTVAPTESTIIEALRAFLLAVLPSSVEVVQGQVNRVPEPEAERFVVMWPIMRPRLATNVDAFDDSAFTASIAGAVLTVSDLLIGTVVPGRSLYGVGVNTTSVIGDQISGTPGGVGTYAVSPSQTVASTTMAAGATTITQPTELVVQLDVHGPDLAAGGDMAAAISTTFRDAFAVDFFTANYPTVSPLFADDPRQVPFQNAEQQWETRYVVDVHLQVDQAVSIPQQYADAVSVEIISVDAVYPPS